MRAISICTALAVMVLLAACPKPTAQNQSAGPRPAMPQFPVMRSQRDYIKVHPNVEKAWGMVEATYAVIMQKWADSGMLLASSNPAEQQQGTAMREQVNQEIQNNIFLINEQIDQLFQDALAAEPDNALNYAAYAYYLKSRKRVDDTGKPVDTEQQAVEQIDKAIELWPDESSFYLLKINIITAAQICHEWVRSTPYERELIAQRMDIVRELLQKAEQYDPDNAAIDYFAALMEGHYGDSQLRQGSEEEVVPFAELRDRVMRHIRNGNAKSDNRFWFPPPLQPYYKTAKNMKLDPQSLEPVYVDQWNQFGHWETILVDTLMTKLTDGWTWKDNREDVGQLMLMMYKLGETEPYDRSFFGLQLKLLQPFQEKSEPGSQERLAFAEALRYLDSHYMDLSSWIIDRRMVTDPTQIGVTAVHEVELKRSRDTFLKDYSQGHFAAFLRKANEVLDLGLDLGDDPEKW